MSDLVDETTDGRFRVVLEHDEYADMPDGHGQGYVFAVDYRYGYRVEVLHDDDGYTYESDAGWMAGFIREQLDRGEGLDWDRLERKLRKRYGMVSMARVDRRGGGTLLNVVTGDMCDVWGIPAGAPIRNESARLDDWAAWDEGDVWTVVVQASREECLIDRGRFTGDITCAACGRECDCLMCQRGAAEKRWEDVDSIGGFYGRECAAESAREQLATFAGVSSEVIA